MLYGGAKGGGKSVFFCQWAYLQCRKLIELFELKDKQKFPLPVGFMGRKRGVDFTKTTLESWKKFIPAELYRIRPLEKEIIVEEKVKILYGGMDDEQNVISNINMDNYTFSHGICGIQAQAFA